MNRRSEKQMGEFLAWREDLAQKLAQEEQASAQQRGELPRLAEGQTPRALANDQHRPKSKAQRKRTR